MIRFRLIFWAGSVLGFFIACSNKDMSQSETVNSVSSRISFPGGGNDGYCVANSSVQFAAKQIALTFDDGPASQTLTLSSYLKSKGIKATFFIVGQNCGGCAATLAQLTADGHLVANHTQHHWDLTSTGSFPTGANGDAAIVNEFVMPDAMIAPYVPNGHFVFRAPYGDWNSRDYNVIHASAMNKYVGPIKWDIGSAMTNNYGADWDCWQNTSGYGQQTTKQCGDRYLNEITAVGRGIVLMHDADYGNSNNHSLTTGVGNTIDMVKYLIDGNAGVQGLIAQGYSFLRLDEVPDILAQFTGGNPPPNPPDAGGNCAFNPTWQQTTFANEWWVEYTISGTIASAELDIVGGQVVPLTNSYQKWVGSTPVQIPSGTQVFLKTKNTASATAQTQQFPYLVTTQPTTLCGGTCVPNCAGHTCGDDGCGGSCGTCVAGKTCSAGTCITPTGQCGTFNPTWNQDAEINAWWVEYLIGGATITSAYLEVPGKGNVTLTPQWGGWMGSSPFQIPAGTSVVLHADNNLGQHTLTNPFGYMTVQQPTTLLCAP